MAAPLSSTTAYGYDAHGNRTSVTDPRGLATSYVYDGIDNLIQVSSPDTGTTVYVVDDAGNRIQQTDAAGVVVQMSYDALNRIAAKTYPADPAENVTWRYDEPAAGFGIGRLTSVTDSSGSTAYVYDARGNVVQETHVIGAQSYVTAYAYDLANHVVQTTYPSGRIVGYTRDAMGRIAGVATQANSSAVPVAVASSATYAPFGPLTSLSYGNGLNLSATYDQDYQPSGRLVTGAASVQDLSYGIDADGNITGIADHLASARSQIFQYDSLSRLTYASGLYGALAYGYDAVGNRTSQSGGTTNLAETYTYAANSNQLLAVANGGTTRSLAYSPTGNVATDNRGSGTALSFTYDLSDRMVQVANQNQPLASYAHNFTGQRVAKTTSSTITHFLYDRTGHLLAESNGATGAAQTEYLWLDDMPLALVTGGALYFIHPDHLGTPQKATDAAQNLAWDAVLRPFGQTEQQTFPSLTNLRFPGQYFDVEDGLHQNWFRDYDSSIGRYVESDPIGLEGGINTYAYVEGDPLGNSDPLGLRGPIQPLQIDPTKRNGGRPSLVPLLPLPIIICLIDPSHCGLIGGGSSGDKSDCPCPPCKTVSGKIVPLGTIAHRPLETSPPGETAHGIAGPHYNIYKANQAPRNSPQPCKCFWQPLGAVPPEGLPAGAMPIEPFAD